MCFKYYLKNLILHTPVRYGMYARLAKHRDPNYSHERDKHPVRAKHHGGSGWKPTAEAEFHYRDYENYGEYRTHQIQKFDEIIKISGGFDNRTILEYRKRFYRRFRRLPTLLPLSAKIICAGARQGTEVEVLRDLGFQHAIGIDLNPGPDNPYVRQGDFMAFQEPDNSLDLIYSNCVDHAFDLRKFFGEHRRVLKPGGYALYDLAGHGEAGAFETVEWPSQESVIALMLEYFQKLVKVETESEHGWKWVLLQKDIPPTPASKS